MNNIEIDLDDKIIFGRCPRCGYYQELKKTEGVGIFAGVNIVEVSKNGVCFLCNYRFSRILCRIRVVDKDEPTLEERYSKIKEWIEERKGAKP